MKSREHLTSVKTLFGVHESSNLSEKDQENFFFCCLIFSLGRNILQETREGVYERKLGNTGQTGRQIHRSAMLSSSAKDLISGLRIHTINTIPTDSGDTDVFIQVKTTALGTNHERIHERMKKLIGGPKDSLLADIKSTAKKGDDIAMIQDNLTEKVHRLECDLSEAEDGKAKLTEKVRTLELQLSELVPEAKKVDQGDTGNYSVAKVVAEPIEQEEEPDAPSCSNPSKCTIC